ncbi:hypothetical protein [Streptomyces griseorubiginosus]|uniref:hypothetical protein n=1 Tax=Streptomyces griseorubiginosus TaxID=67304 RepID=UPI0036E212EE
MNAFTDHDSGVHLVDVTTTRVTTPQAAPDPAAQPSTVSVSERALEGLPADWQRAARRVID